MVKIRLARTGKRNDPFYRVVAIDERQKTTSKNLEILGFWHPKENLKEINKTKIQAWVKKGAIVTPAVKKLLA